jgi:hypothetical protein
LLQGRRWLNLDLTGFQHKPTAKNLPFSC